MPAVHGWVCHGVDNDVVNYSLSAHQYFTAEFFERNRNRLCENGNSCLWDACCKGMLFQLKKLQPAFLMHITNFTACLVWLEVNSTGVHKNRILELLMSGQGKGTSL